MATCRVSVHTRVGAIVRATALTTVLVHERQPFFLSKLTCIHTQTCAVFCF